MECPCVRVLCVVCCVLCVFAGTIENPCPCDRGDDDDSDGDTAQRRLLADDFDDAASFVRRLLRRSDSRTRWGSVSQCKLVDPGLKAKATPVFKKLIVEKRIMVVST